MEDRIFVTILTPTYNRAKLLGRVYESIKKQNFSNFEWIIVDDGSIDNTDLLVKSWIEESRFPIIYFHQENSGKHIAINRGVNKARGELFFILDSDDWLIDNSLEDIWRVWNSIPEEQKIYFAGVCGLRAYKDGRIIGTKYPFDSMDSDPVEIRTFYDVKGDKSEVFRTEVLREFPFPDNLGKFVTEGLVWNRIAQKYKMRYVNKVWICTEYLQDGLTSKSTELRVKNLDSTILYYKEFVELKNKRVKFRYRLKNMINYVRFSMHKGVSLKNLISLSGRALKLLCLIVLPVAFLFYLRDKMIVRV